MRIDPPSDRPIRSAAEEEHVAVVRRRVAAGIYDSTPIVSEVARRILASGDLSGRPTPNQRES